jgi:hypothetical protein
MFTFVQDFTDGATQFIKAVAEKLRLDDAKRKNKLPQTRR